ncbi:hypothetical protein Q4I28_002300 [Leishmania naiffi]|uniref:Uncharacterized protein n=1 Tax=Leishmania naiffi TaxID=5678 RepID=A0AAW3C193_9TRYP
MLLESIHHSACVTVALFPEHIAIELPASQLSPACVPLYCAIFSFLVSLLHLPMSSVPIVTSTCFSLGALSYLCGPLTLDSEAERTRSTRTSLEAEVLRIRGSLSSLSFPFVLFLLAMRVSPNSLSDTASRLEQDRERDFFRLLYIVDRARRFLSVPVTNVDWRLTCDCLDDMNHRYADTNFLLGFTGGYVLRNRAGRTLLSRFWFSTYLGLVFYDWELRRVTRAPALEYWNSICTVDTEVGRIARVLHTPARFYEAAPISNTFSGVPPPLSRGSSSSSTPTLYGTSMRDWFFRYASDTMSSVLLMTLCSYLFAGSSWRHRTGDNVEVTALVINNRFFHWKVFESCQVQRNETTEYNISLKWFPSFAASDSLRRSFQCRDLILERSTLGARLWYRTHFSLLRCLGLDP